jgi:chromosomal replication initiation ATPase DnaA
VCQADTPKTVSVICLTALVTGIPITAIRGARRQAPVVRAREIAAYEIREWCRKSLPEIGRMIAGHERYKIFDHSTVLHAITSIQEKLSCGDAEIVKAIATIDSVLELFWKPGSGHPLSWVVSASYQAPCSHETVL